LFFLGFDCAQPDRKNPYRWLKNNFLKFYILPHPNPENSGFDLSKGEVKTETLPERKGRLRGILPIKLKRNPK